jgi:NADH dehydrogenase
MKHVLIVGGGFAGLSCARTLASQKDLHVTLIDKNNYHQFQPLLYQVATAQLSPSDAAFTLRDILKGHQNVDVKMAEVVSADLATHTVTTADRQNHQGDFLVLASGSQPNFFSTPGAQARALPLYSLRQAELLRSHLLAMFEAADRDHELIQQGALNFVVVGGGPTGVELAGALSDLLAGALRNEYRDLALDKAKIILVDHGETVLGPFSKKAQSYAFKVLEQRGVQLRLGLLVKEVSERAVVLAEGTTIPAHTVIWAGGVKAAPLAAQLGLPTGRGGRIDVQPDLTVKGFPGVYALGDFANIAADDGRFLPQLASVAQQCGRSCARNIMADVALQPRQPFHYFDKGIMAMIGRNAAVAEIGEHHHELEGVLGFAAWLGVHASLLSTARARIEAFVEWAWDYFAKNPSNQLLDRTDRGRILWADDAQASGLSPSQQTPSPSAPNTKVA